ncbi:hypothetical protein PsYK624_059150 [Phanerochaete sordida]|uniref:F-box domain-containing protein n=1 Tax=Phanerochaete sordida TaxID=48140 RepID=A0A9P3G840_9APHY|nr:hypothetical protein PsYK624_059150 [Phanerochaete sordida]
MDSTRHKSESSSLFSRDIRSFSLGRSGKARSRSADTQIHATPVPPQPSRTPVLSRLPASVQHLPPEIVLNILSFALPSLYDGALHFRRAPNVFFDGVEAQPNFRRILKETQTCLLRAALICRAWYPVAVEFLYGCPFLHCSSNATALSRTLENAPHLRHLVKEAWVFNEEGGKLSDPLGMKRKTSKRVQADLTRSLRKYTILDSVVICNHGVAGQDNGTKFFPIDNIMVYTLPAHPDSDAALSHLTLYGPSFFNQPFERHAKPQNFDPERLQHLCLRDIPPSPAVVKCAPYVPTLPRVHTLQFGLQRHACAPVVSAGTFPALRALEVFRDIHDGAPAEGMRAVLVDEAAVRKLERLHLVGRAIERVQFRIWADGQCLESLRHLALGPLHPYDFDFFADWRVPETLETLEVVVWFRRGNKAQKKKKRAVEKRMQEAEDEEEIKDAFRAILACAHRNRQARSFKKLVVRAVTALPQAVQPLVDELERKCASHDWQFKLHEGGFDQWVAERLYNSRD